MSPHLRHSLLRMYRSNACAQSPFTSLETSFEEGANNVFSSPANSSGNVNMSGPFSGGGGGGSRRSSRRGSRLPSFRGSCDSENWSSGGSGGSGSSSGGHGDLAAAKSNYRIMVLGASR